VTLHYDLHIHTCLSPCADEDMTPNNIVNMAVLKGLHVIAASDHNTVGNAASVMAAGKRAGLLVVPAMELCTAEEIHLLCLFPSLEAGKAFEAEAFPDGEDTRNRPDVFGNQWLLDEYDEMAGTEHRMLLAAARPGVDEALRLLAGHGGVAFPAHIDRDAYSMTSTLGLVPPEYGFRAVEISRHADAAAMRRLHPETENACYLVNSDAHHLWDISESGHIVLLPECSIEAVISALREGKGFA
jgi:predicted metal-dependent phosphoesterase TrpH